MESIFRCSAASQHQQQQQPQQHRDPATEGARKNYGWWCGEAVGRVVCDGPGDGAWEEQRRRKTHTGNLQTTTRRRRWHDDEDDKGTSPLLNDPSTTTPLALYVHASGIISDELADPSAGAARLHLGRRVCALAAASTPCRRKEARSTVAQAGQHIYIHIYI